MDVGFIGLGHMGEPMAARILKAGHALTLCDIRRENVEMAAVTVEELLGFRPATFTDLEEMVNAIPDLGMVDVVTDPSVHHTVVCQALDLGRTCRLRKRYQPESGC